MRTVWTFHTAGSLHFGQHAVAQLGEIATRLGGGRTLIMTDPHLVRAGLVDQVRGPLAQAGLEVEVFEGGVPEPPVALAEECAERARKQNIQLLVGLGGGSNMDLAKITAVLLSHGGQARDYFGDDKVPGPVVPLICIPTTAGTGSEVSAASVLTDQASGMKVGVLSNYLRPRVAVVDPLLTRSCPPKVTADSGIDALTHALEAYTAVDNEEFPLPEGERSVYQGRHPFGDLLAEKAIALVGQHLVTAVQDGTNLAAREGMALAATFAGMAFSNVGVAVVHALEYPVGVATHCSHGAGNGLLLPYVMRFNLSAKPERFAQIARWLGKDTTGLSTQEAAEASIVAVEELRHAIGIPNRLRELGVQASQLPDFATKAFGVKRILRVNPRPVTQADLQAILEAAL